MIIKIDTSKYSLDAILAASYVFIDRYYIFHRFTSETELECSFRVKKETNIDNLEKEYLAELNKASMYIELDKINNKYRKYIVGQSLFSLANDQYMNDGEATEASGDRPVTGADDTMDDPLEIAVPWEQKYGDKLE